MHKQFPSVRRLQVHLENEQLCLYDECEENVDEVLENNQRTTLTEWFEKNKTNEEARNLKYITKVDIYLKYINNVVYKEIL